MPEYEFTYCEIYYTDESRREMKASSPKTSPIQARDDERAEDLAKGILAVPSEKKLLFRKVRIKLVRIVTVSSWG